MFYGPMMATISWYEEMLQILSLEAWGGEVTCSQVADCVCILSSWQQHRSTSTLAFTCSDNPSSPPAFPFTLPEATPARFDRSRRRRGWRPPARASTASRAPTATRWGTRSRSSSTGRASAVRAMRPQSPRATRPSVATRSSTPHSSSAAAAPRCARSWQPPTYGRDRRRHRGAQLFDLVEAYRSERVAVARACPSCQD